MDFEKLVLGQFAYLQEGVAGHIHHSLVPLFHKLEELLDHGFQEIPVVSQELRILAHYKHDAGGDNCFGRLPFFDLTEVEQNLQNSN